MGGRGRPWEALLRHYSGIHDSPRSPWVAIPLRASHVQRGLSHHRPLPAVDCETADERCFALSVPVVYLIPASLLSVPRTRLLPSSGAGQ